ncbi:MAG: RNA polymerase sigma factor [Solirubrobacteraceae bacterium]
MSPSVSVRLLLTQSDARLVELARGGHERAFEALVERYRRPLLGYCRHQLLPHERAEDAVQQGLLRAWLALRDGTEVRDVKPWLYSIVHNTALNMRRSGYSYAQLSETLCGAGAPAEDLDRRIAVREALAGLAALPEMQREALLRTAVDGSSYQDAATKLGLSEGAVRGLVHRARVALRTGATALTPSPLLSWMLGSGSTDAPLASRLAEVGAGGGGSAGLVVGLAKLAATAATAVVVVGGIGVSRQARDAHRPRTHRSVHAAVSASTVGAPGARAEHDESGLAASRAGAGRSRSTHALPLHRTVAFRAGRGSRGVPRAAHTPRRHLTLAPASRPALLQLSTPSLPTAHRDGSNGDSEDGGRSGGSGTGGGTDGENRQGSSANDGGATESGHSSHTAAPDRSQASDGGQDASRSESGSSASGGGTQSEVSRGHNPDNHTQSSPGDSGGRDQESRGEGTNAQGTTPEGGASTNTEPLGAAGGESEGQRGGKD